MLREVYQDAESRMKGAIQALEDDLGTIRTGRASPALVEKLQVDYYGTLTPLIQLATITVPEPRSLLIRPFDASTLKVIERTILASDLGITPNNDGKAVRLNLPPLTEERRRELAKVVNHRLEDARIALRNIRRDVIRDINEYEQEKLISEDECKRAEVELQKMTDKYVEEVAVIGSRKEKEIMEV
jgi:ribosome recycling factor